LFEQNGVIIIPLSKISKELGVPTGLSVTSIISVRMNISLISFQSSNNCQLMVIKHTWQKWQRSKPVVCGCVSICSTDRFCKFVYKVFSKRQLIIVCVFSYIRQSRYNVASLIPYYAGLFDISHEIQPVTRQLYSMFKDCKNCDSYMWKDLKALELQQMDQRVSAASCTFVSKRRHLLSNWNRSLLIAARYKRFP
jgi:hypothetical protein